LNSRVRFVITAVLLMTAVILLRLHNHGEVFPPRPPLASFPLRLGGWTGSDLPMAPDTLAILGPGEFVFRDYGNNSEDTPPVNLLIAYFPTQEAGDAIHSPKHCLPGNGWAPVESSRMVLTLPGHAPFPANHYVIAKGEERQLVIYWFWAHDRAVASEYWVKFYLVADSIRMHRSDGSLFRLLTPLRPGETEDSAQQRLLSFAGNVVPLTNQYVPK
jgi:EpsI family protein